MTRHRKGLRPVSQSGFHRVPRNPNQRVAKEGGTKVAGTALDAFNDKADERTLHSTKGWRNLSVKRGRAQMLVATILNGGRANMANMARFMRTGI